jgi:hypothetical protein
MATFALAPDGSVVYRVTPLASVAASTLNSSLLTAFGYTVTTEAVGSLSVNPYEAGIRGGNGGGHFEAVYNHGSALAAGQSLQWVQVVTTNDPLGTAVSPYLDNRLNATTLSKPFYSLTAENSASGPAQPAGSIYFYDYSTRPPGDIATHNPITWNASLYPVIVQGTTIKVEGGESWGWTGKKALVGTDTGIFVNASPGATTTGLNTSTFKWGTGSDPSSLTFTPAPFDGNPGISFKVGTITYHNGTTFGGEATSVDLRNSFNLTNVPEKNFIFTTTISINTTENTTDPVASADQVRFANNGPQFNVQEGNTASADLFMTLSTGLTLPAGSGFDSAFSASPFDPSPNFNVTSVGLANASPGGFVAIVGDTGDNSLVGTSADDTMLALDGNDTIRGGLGNDTIDGGPGIDTAIFSGLRSAYTLTALSGNGVRVVGPDGSDTLTNVEKLGFDDVTLSWPPDSDSSRYGDFDNNGRSEVLFQSDAGAIVIWQTNSAGALSNVVSVGSLPTGFRIDGTGNFNSTAGHDILLRSPTSVAVLPMNGTTAQTMQVLGGTSPLWLNSGIGDFTGDGQSDLLFRNVSTGEIATWGVANNALSTVPKVLGSTAPQYHIVAVDDFTGDGQADILFRHDNGDIAIWRVANNALAGAPATVGSTSTAYHVVGTGDFDGNGANDILFRSNNGDLAVWLLNSSGQLLSAPAAIGNASLQYHVDGTGDLNGDGRTDIIFRDGNGTLVEWLMNGTALAAPPSVLGSATLDYSIAAHHFDLI